MYFRQIIFYNYNFPSNLNKSLLNVLNVGSIWKSQIKFAVAWRAYVPVCYIAEPMRFDIVVQFPPIQIARTSDRSMSWVVNNEDSCE